MMLQEELDVPIASQMGLYSAFKYVILDGPENTEVWDPHAPPPVEEPEDDVKIRVDYLESDFTDDHFDLRKKEHLLGKALARLSQKQADDTVHQSLQLLGWVLFEKWDKVLALKTGDVAKDCLDKAKELVNAAEFAEKENVLKYLDGKKESAMDMSKTLLENIQSAVKEHEPKYIQKQMELFQSWESSRESEMEKQLALYKKEARIKELQRIKKEFEEKEKKLFFFERQEEFDTFKEDKILAWKRKLPPRTWGPRINRKKKEVVSDSYIPPEV